MTRDELLGRMSLRELAEWEVLETVEPFGDRRLDVLTGVFCAHMVNLFRKPGAPAAKPSDYMPSFETEPATEAVQSPQEMRAIYRAYQDKRKQQKERAARKAARKAAQSV